MINNNHDINDDNIDVHVDEEILECLNLSKNKSFFLFAGAGSGKTRSLVNVLDRFKENYGNMLRLSNQKVAVITYTNAACNEIISRLNYDDLFSVSTIHSFAWTLIKPYQNDIRDWLKNNLRDEITVLEEENSKGRSSKANDSRNHKLTDKLERFNKLDTVTKFTYNPNGNNFSHDSLNHSEVIKICSFFLKEKKLMRSILVKKYPILLIDESQDTNEKFMDALIYVQECEKNRFTLGLFGDIMQRIYFDGKSDLDTTIPNDWLKPSKKMNHRCPKRIVKLINRIRNEVDTQEQLARSDSEEGYVRLFVIQDINQEKLEVEKLIRKKMSDITQDYLWTSDTEDIKTLILEHKMASKRLGFFEFFEPLYKVDSLKTGLLDGSLTELRFFSQIIIPLVNAFEKSDKFEICKIIKAFSPLLNENKIKNAKKLILDIKEINILVTKFFNLWSVKPPSLKSIIEYIYKTNLFELSDTFQKLFSEKYQNDSNENDADNSSKLSAWHDALKCNYDQIKAYDLYISDKSNFGTHQGIKGLEFERVMVILDDYDAGGFMFSYEKLFGAKELSKVDENNLIENKDNSIDRTRRLFYVTCSRTKKSLAIVAYTKDSNKVIKTVLDKGWFYKEEIFVYDETNKFESII